MLKPGFAGLTLGAIMAFALPVLAQTGTAERLYVMDCRHNAATDQSRWSPGVNVGKPIELSDNCHLIKHGSDWLLWDTGYPDAVADKPVTGPTGTATRTKTLAAQLTEVGVKPADIRYVAVSHTHGDHIGNVDLFPDSTLLMQKAEFDWAFAAEKKPPFTAERPIRKDNWDNRRVASMNASAGQTQASSKKIEELVVQKKAQLWINHDKTQSQAQTRSPQFYD